jgi:hypothetical protein
LRARVLFAQPVTDVFYYCVGIGPAQAPGDFVELEGRVGATGFALRLQVVPPRKRRGPNRPGLHPQVDFHPPLFLTLTLISRFVLIYYLHNRPSPIADGDEDSVESFSIGRRLLHGLIVEGALYALPTHSVYFSIPLILSYGRFVALATETGSAGGSPAVCSPTSWPTAPPARR